MSSITDKFRDYRPSKGALLGTAAASIVLTMIVGFTWGGWVTGGSAEQRAENAAQDAVAALAADICFNRFLADPGARVNLAALQEESAYRRDGVLEDGGWVTLGDREGPINGAADICADRLAEVELSELPEIPVAEASAIPAADASATETAVQ